jgi:LCP family protein required for cell wall assembly
VSSENIAMREPRQPGRDYQPGHARQKRLEGWKLMVSIASLVVVSLVVSAGTVVGWALFNITSSLQTVALPGHEAPVLAGIGEWEGGFNVLVVGSDTRVGQGEQFGETDSELNDVNLLVHVSENHDHATVISFPRDTLIDIPACEQDDGSMSTPRTMAALNTTWSIGGLPCVAKTLEELTGLEIGYAGVMTFTGVAQLSTAVGGVDVCITEPIFDPWSGLDLPEAGWNTVEGGQALAFLRTRHGVGDGSDLARISSQQVYMSALVRKLQADGVLNDPTKLYSIAQVAAQTMVLSSSLGSLDVMVSMARALRNIPDENIVFVQFPVLDAPEGYSGKVVPDWNLAEALLTKVRNDEPYVLGDNSVGRGSREAPAEDTSTEADAPADAPADSASDQPASDAPTEDSSTSDSGQADTQADAPAEDPAPAEAEVLEGLVGQTASDVTCAVAN